jgi:hypothetical protein
MVEIGRIILMSQLTYILGIFSEKFRENKTELICSVIGAVAALTAFLAIMQVGLI